MDELKPVALFFNTYNLISETGIKTEGSIDYITKMYFGVMHVMVSFGYKFVKYYNGGNNFRTDYFVRVSTGDADMTMGYVKLYDGAIVQEGYAVHIY